MDNQAIFDEALAAADKAFLECKPNAVVFGTAVGLFGREMVPGTERVETEGLCGFAWVEVRPTRSPFAAWLRKAIVPSGGSGIGGTCGHYDEYRRCVSVSSNVSPVARPSQSYDRKCAWAYAFAKVLQSYGIRAYSADRLD